MALSEIYAVFSEHGCLIHVIHERSVLDLGEGSISTRAIPLRFNTGLKMPTCYSAPGMTVSWSKNQLILLLYLDLAREALDESVLLWGIRPKLHQFEHMCLGEIESEKSCRILDFCPRYGNPRHWSNYLNEDHIGRSKLLACE